MAPWLRIVRSILKLHFFFGIFNVSIKNFSSSKFSGYDEKSENERKKIIKILSAKKWNYFLLEAKDFANVQRICKQEIFQYVELESPDIINRRLDKCGNG